MKWHEFAPAVVVRWIVVCSRAPSLNEATMRLRTIAGVLIFTVMTFVVAPGASAESTAGLVAIPAGHDSDLKLYAADGSIVSGEPLRSNGCRAPA